jgi:DNA-binding CsgD family transcriptional regulator
MRLVVEHIRRATLVTKSIDCRKAEVETFADSLDHLSAGIFLIDANGQIVHANAAGHAILAARDVLLAAGGRIVAADVRVRHELREAIARIADSDVALRPTGVALGLTAGIGERYVAHVLPLRACARRRASMSSPATTALVIHKAVIEACSRPEVIANAYNLTPAELGVLLTFVEVGRVPDVAEALGVAETTVKTHLRRLFAKTGTGVKPNS